MSKHGDMKLSKLELGVTLQACADSHAEDCQCCLEAMKLVASQMEDKMIHWLKNSVRIHVLDINAGSPDLDFYICKYCRSVYRPKGE